MYDDTTDHYIYIMASHNYGPISINMLLQSPKQKSRKVKSLVQSCMQVILQLTNDPVQRHMNICKQLLASTQDAHFWCCIVTANGNLIYFCYPD